MSTPDVAPAAPDVALGAGRQTRRGRGCLRATAVAFALVITTYLAFGWASTTLSGLWRPPGVPITLDGGLQDTVNGLRVTVMHVSAAEDGPTARIVLGDRGGSEGTLHQRGWLCQQAWGCVNAWSITPPSAEELAPDGEVGGAQGHVTVVYAPPPWFFALLLGAVAVIVWRRRVRRRRDAAAPPGPDGAE